jgi:hypothetical protein
MQFTVKIHKWVDGVLITIKKSFLNLDQALRQAREEEGHSIKIYDSNNQITHHFQHHKKPDNTYA